MQALQELRHRILEASSVLESCSGLAARLHAHCVSLEEASSRSGTLPLEDVLSIEAYAADIKVHQQSVAGMLVSLQGTFDLVGHFIHSFYDFCYLVISFAAWNTHPPAPPKRLCCPKLII
jgi:hypothetical protein